MPVAPHSRTRPARLGLTLALLSSIGCQSGSQLAHRPAWLRPNQAEVQRTRQTDLVAAADSPQPESPTASPKVQLAAFQESGTDPATGSVVGSGPVVMADEPVVLADGGEVNNSGSITLAELEALALANNPTLSQLALATQEAAGYRTQVGLKPNPTVGYQGVQLADQSTDQHTLFIEQEIVRGDKLLWNRAVLNESLRAQLLELETQRWRVVTDIRTRFYNALALQRRLQLIEEFQAVTDKGLELAELRRQAAEGSQIDVLQAKVQKNEVDLAGRQTQVAATAAWRELIALSGAPNLPAASLAGELPVELEQLDWSSVAAKTIVDSPELEVAQARVAQARTNLQRQLQQPIPNVILQMAAGVDNGTNSGLMNVQLGAPIPVHNQNQGNIAAARAEYCRRLREVERLENSIRARLANVSRQYDAALAAVSSYTQEILPAAEESLRLAELAYKAGETSFIQVLVARRTYFDSQLMFVQAQGDLAQAQAQVDGFVLSGGLDPVNDGQIGDDSLRGLTFSQQ